MKLKQCHFFLFWKFSFELINHLFRFLKTWNIRRKFQSVIATSNQEFLTDRVHPCFLLSADVPPHTHTSLLTIIRTLNSTKIYPLADWIHTVNGYLFLVAEQRKSNVITRQTRISFYGGLMYKQIIGNTSPLPKQSIPSLFWTREIIRGVKCVIIIKHNTQMAKLSLRGL